MSKDTQPKSPLEFVSKLTVPTASTAPSTNAMNLKDLKTKRSSLKGRITKYKKYINILTSATSVTATDICVVAQRYERFRDLSFNFDDLQSQIELQNSDELDDELDIREEFELEFSSLIAQTHMFLEKHKSQTQAEECHLSSKSGCSHKNNVSFKLPVIKISNFDGTYFKWLEFRDTFSSLIHNNNNIESIHKFHYLNSYLEGEASHVISNLEVTSVNYQEAWRLLCERYNNEKQLINNHLNSLLSMQPLPRDSAKDLRFLVDHISKNLRALNTLGEPTNHWDTLIVHLASAKLDSSTSFKWEEHRISFNKSPTLKEFFDFLRSRADIIESVRSNKGDKQGYTQFHSQRPEKYSHSKSFAISAAPSISTTGVACVLCNGSHRLYDCASFLGKTVEERVSEVMRLKLCMNCLRKGHSSHQCRLGPCSKCKSRHNTLLHRNSSQAVNINNVQTNNETDHDSDQSFPDNDNIVSMSASTTSSVLLSTAIVEIYNPNTNQHLSIRALLDSGSQSSLITNSLKTKLQLTPQPTQVDIVGVGNIHSSNAIERCVVKLKSKTSSFESELSCLVLPQISSNLPNKSINICHLKFPSNVKLADPSFHLSAPVDMLLGADMFWYLIEPEQILLGHNQPIMCKSKLGWILAGPMTSNDTSKNKSIRCNHITIHRNSDSISNETLNDNLMKFWEIEQIPQLASQQTDEEILCEAHFAQHTYRNKEGRFCVKLPLLTEPDCLGDSRKQARNQFLALEKRFNKNPEFKQLYSNFIQEYSNLGHLSEVSSVSDQSYFIPHHAVWKPSSESSAIRVVFNGSARTSSSFSINDILMVGPQVQDSLFNILLRFRQHAYVLSGDIEKMYRQIELQECHRDLQVILWREHTTDDLKLLRLNTVTYGYASSSFLSTRCLWQVGEESVDPTIKEIIQNDFLVDDLLTGSDNINDLIYIKRSVENALKANCLNLRKYRSNSPCVLVEAQNKQDNLTISHSSHTLGVGWNPNEDIIHFPCAYESQTESPTKRSILSDSCKIFDPLGILCILSIVPKIIIQKLWVEKIDWDEPVPEVIRQDWQSFIDSLKYLHTLHIPRHVLCSNPTYIEIHAFCDASKNCFASAVYLKSYNIQGDMTVRLLCAKARVAPVKPTTIPRLELCACLLGAQLAAAVCRALRCLVTSKVFWTDSSIALSWLGMRYDKLKTYVANRVGAILELTKQSQWRHVPTDLNPADLATRGVDGNKIKKCDLWWNGPTFLLQPESSWPPSRPQMHSAQTDDLPETRINLTTCNETTKQSLIDFDRYSKLNLLQRSFAYVLRFINNCKNRFNKHIGILQPEELSNSFKCLVRLSQAESFPKELVILGSNKQLNSKSTIISLSPYLDKDVIRVGGRLDNSCYPYEKRHPMLLHAKHKLTKLLFQQEHLRLLHAGPQLLLSCVRDSVWPIAGRDLARTTARQCVVCRKASARMPSPIMGMLPEQRVNPGFPFESASVDFAGPYHITDRKGRGCKISKCYLCIFVCSRYKCVHLEAVSELSKDAFILSLRRFISRRGKPSDIFSDNGRNFVATAREISEFLTSHSDDIVSFTSEEGIKFHFQPAYAPHFGGLVESAVKSAKFFLKRQLSNAHLTFEELATLFSQIEAILNSRPLSPLSSCPNDYHSLTPGHFLIGRPLTSLPTTDLQTKNYTRLNRYQRLEHIRQHFWNRWQAEYIAELQQKNKWRTHGSPLQIGDLVLLKEDNSPPMHWKLGRVTATFPGKDGIARVAEVKTTMGTFRRGVRYLCPLLEPAEDTSLEAGASKAPEDVRAQH